MGPRRVFEHINEPAIVRRINGWFTMLWLVLVYPTVAYWHSSVLWVAILSIWANVVSHYTAWLEARVEVRAERLEAAADQTAPR